MVISITREGKHREEEEVEEVLATVINTTWLTVLSKVLSIF